jgi:hypothetical protein
LADYQKLAGRDLSEYDIAYLSEYDIAYPCVDGVAERWRAIRVTDFERRQMVAVRSRNTRPQSRPRHRPQRGASPPIYSALFGLDLRSPPRGGL